MVIKVIIGNYGKVITHDGQVVHLETATTDPFYSCWEKSVAATTTTKLVTSVSADPPVPGTSKLGTSFGSDLDHS